jgi:hypothetical protein
LFALFAAGCGIPWYLVLFCPLILTGSRLEARAALPIMCAASLAAAEALRVPIKRSARLVTMLLGIAFTWLTEAFWIIGMFVSWYVTESMLGQAAETLRHTAANGVTTAVMLLVVWSTLLAPITFPTGIGLVFLLRRCLRVGGTVGLSNRALPDKPAVPSDPA